MYKIVRLSDLKIVAEYEDTNPFGGPWGCTDGSHVALKTTEGFDHRGFKAVEGPALEFDQAQLDDIKRAENQKAKASYSAQREAASDVQIYQLLGGLSESTHLMFAVYNLFLYVAGVQAAAQIQDESLDPSAQAGKAYLAQVKTELYDSVQSLRDSRDQDIEAFTPPNTDIDPLY